MLFRVTVNTFQANGLLTNRILERPVKWQSLTISKEEKKHWRKTNTNATFEFSLSDSMSIHFEVHSIGVFVSLKNNTRFNCFELEIISMIGIVNLPNAISILQASFECHKMRSIGSIFRFSHNQIGLHFSAYNAWINEV